LGQAPVELDEIERAGWWAFPVGPVLGRSAASAADAGGSVRSPDRAAGFEKHGVVPALVEVVAVGQAGAGAQGGGQGELVEVGAVVELVEGIGVVEPSTVRLVFPIPASPETSTTGGRRDGVVQRRQFRLALQQSDGHLPMLSAGPPSRR
jgi:hypothetical protein